MVPSSRGRESTAGRTGRSHASVVSVNCVEREENRSRRITFVDEAKAAGMNLRTLPACAPPVIVISTMEGQSLKEPTIVGPWSLETRQTTRMSYDSEHMDSMNAEELEELALTHQAREAEAESLARAEAAFYGSLEDEDA
jgi:hypothetical protein